MADNSDYDRIPVTLVGLLAVFLIAGLIASRFIATAGTAGEMLPDLSAAHVVEVRDASGRTVLSGEFRERVDHAGNMERDAALTERGGRHVIGKIEVSVPGPHSMSQGQELDVDVIELRPNGKYGIFIDDREAATLNADDRGSIDVKVHAVTPGQPQSR